MKGRRNSHRRSVGMEKGRIAREHGDYLSQPSDLSLAHNNQRSGCSTIPLFLILISTLPLPLNTPPQHSPPNLQPTPHHTRTPNDNSSDTSPSLPVLQTSSVHSAYYPPPKACDHTARAPASTDSSHTRRRISGNRRRWIWRWLGGWRRFGRCGRRRRRGRGCRRWRICRGRG